MSFKDRVAVTAISNSSLKVNYQLLKANKLIFRYEKCKKVQLRELSIIIPWGIEIFCDGKKKVTAHPWMHEKFSCLPPLHGHKVVFDVE